MDKKDNCKLRIKKDINALPATQAMRYCVFKAEMKFRFIDFVSVSDVDGHNCKKNT